MTPDVRETVAELRQATAEASLYFEIWWVLKSDDSRPDYLPTMNRYNLFFRASSRSNFIALLVNLYRIYETRKDTHNIPDLLKTLRAQQTLPEATLDKIEDVYTNQAKTIWLKVKVLRNEVFAHRANQLNTKDAFHKAGVTANELRDLVEITKCILNEISSAFDGSQHAFNLHAREDTLQLLKNLRAANPKGSGASGVRS